MPDESMTDSRVIACATFYKALGNPNAYRLPRGLLTAGLMWKTLIQYSTTARKSLQRRYLRTRYLTPALAPAWTYTQNPSQTRSIYAPGTCPQFHSALGIGRQAIDADFDNLPGEVGMQLNEQVFIMQADTLERLQLVDRDEFLTTPPLQALRCTIYFACERGAGRFVSRVLESNDGLTVGDVLVAKEEFGDYLAAELPEVLAEYEDGGRAVQRIRLSYHEELQVGGEVRARNEAGIGVGVRPFCGRRIFLSR